MQDLTLFSLFSLGAILFWKMRSAAHGATGRIAAVKYNFYVI
jgi:hypothetical protein